VGLGSKGIAQEDDAVEGFVGNFGADLGVAAEWTRLLAFDVEAGLLGDPFARGAGSYQVERRQQVRVLPGEVDDVGLLLVVGDEGRRASCQTMDAPGG